MFQTDLVGKRVEIWTYSWDRDPRVARGVVRAIGATGGDVVLAVEFVGTPITFEGVTGRVPGENKAALPPGAMGLYRWDQVGVRVVSDKEASEEWAAWGIEPPPTPVTLTFHIRDVETGDIATKSVTVQSNESLYHAARVAYQCQVGVARADLGDWPNDAFRSRFRVFAGTDAVALDAQALEVGGAKALYIEPLDPA